MFFPKEKLLLTPSDSDICAVPITNHLLHVYKHKVIGNVLTKKSASWQMDNGKHKAFLV